MVTLAVQVVVYHTLAGTVAGGFGFSVHIIIITQHMPLSRSQSPQTGKASSFSRTQGNSIVQVSSHGTNNDDDSDNDDSRLGTNGNGVVSTNNDDDSRTNGVVSSTNNDDDSHRSGGDNSSPSPLKLEVEDGGALKPEIGPSRSSTTFQVDKLKVEDGDDDTASWPCERPYKEEDIMTATSSWPRKHDRTNRSSSLSNSTMSIGPFNMEDDKIAIQVATNFIVNTDKQTNGIFSDDDHDDFSRMNRISYHDDDLHNNSNNNRDSDDSERMNDNTTARVTHSSSSILVTTQPSAHDSDGDGDDDDPSLLLPSTMTTLNPTTLNPNCCHPLTLRLRSTTTSSSSSSTITTATKQCNLNVKPLSSADADDNSCILQRIDKRSATMSCGTNDNATATVTDATMTATSVTGTDNVGTTDLQRMTGRLSPTSVTDHPVDDKRRGHMEKRCARGVIMPESTTAKSTTSSLPVVSFDDAEDSGDSSSLSLSSSSAAAMKTSSLLSKSAPTTTVDSRLQRIAELLANAPGDYYEQDSIFRLSKNDCISFLLHEFPTYWLFWYDKNKDDPYRTVSSASDVKNLTTCPIPKDNRGCYFQLMKMTIQQAEALLDRRTEFIDSAKEIDRMEKKPSKRKAEVYTTAFFDDLAQDISSATTRGMNDIYRYYVGMSAAESYGMKDRCNAHEKKTFKSAVSTSYNSTVMYLMVKEGGGKVDFMQLIATSDIRKALLAEHLFQVILNASPDFHSSNNRTACGLGCPAHRAMLKKQGVNGIVEDPRWETKHTMLKDYKTKHGHTNVSQHDPDNKVSVLLL
jgi:hypothetical protein